MDDSRNTHNDIPINELVKQLKDLDKNLTKRFGVPPETPFSWFLKWTCPGCGERLASSEANTIRLGGYLHETRADGSPCGEVYKGELFGLQLLVGIGPEEAATLLEQEEAKAGSG